MFGRERDDARRRLAMPLIAQLSASVAPPVKITRPPGRQQRRDLLARDLDRRLGRAARAVRRMRVGEACSPSQGSIASRASGASGVVA